MICVTIGRGRHRMMLQEWEEAAQAGAKLVELRLDCLRRSPETRILLRNRHTPLVVTIRRSADGGLWRGDEAKRRLLLREAIAAQVDYVDLEMDVAAEIPRFGKTKRIVSFHNFTGVPDDLEHRLDTMRDRDADIVKFAVLVRSVADAARVLDLVKDAPTPTIGIAMGPLGVFTRILGIKYGAPFTYAGFNPDRTFAPGMPQFHALKSDYFLDRLDRDTDVYAVIGDPLGHSLSPAVHNRAFRQLGLNKVMVPIQIPPGEVAGSLESLAFLNLRGISVTIPHKQAVLPLLSRSDQAVDLVNACNTLVPDGAGKWLGYNTDYKAALDSLEIALGGLLANDASPLLDKQALVLGAGGVARSLAFGLVRRGAGVTICNRTEERASKLAEEAGCRSVPWGMRAGTLCDVLINCTSVGMHPNVDESPVPGAAFKPGTLAFDTVYHPENTLFLKLARDHDCTIVTGVEMFVRQAALQFELYTGRPAPLELMRQVVREKFSPLRSS